MNREAGFRGVTLIEVVAAGALLGLLMSLLLGLFVPALRTWADSQRAAEGGQQLLFVANRLGQDLGQSVPRTLGITQAREFRFLAMQPSENSPEYGTDVQVTYACPDGELWRHLETRPSAEPEVSAVEGLSPPALPEGRPQQRLATGVSLFEVRLESPWSCSIRLHFRRTERQYSLVTSYSSRYAPLQPSRKRSENLTYPGPWQTLYAEPGAPRI